MAQDYYEVLGVQRNATKSEIKSAFRKLARQYHPDVSDAPDAEAKFKELGEAYEILSDDTKRARYDQFGHAGVNANGFGGTAGFGGFEDIFEEILTGFGGRSRRQRGPRPGDDIRIDIDLSFEESIFGVNKEMEYDRLETCEHCDGSRAEPGTSFTRCPTCQGSGQERRVQNTFLGQYPTITTCSQCQGRGEISETPCNECSGNGRQRKTHTFSADVPPGVREGTRIQFGGGGDAGDRGAPYGSLYLVVHPQEHEFFKRREHDIILDIPVNVAQAALGDQVSIPTVDGDVELTIPAGVQTGKVFRLRGKGIPRLRRDGTTSGRGDQLVYITVAVPTKLTDEQRELFEQLAETMGREIQPQTNGRGFFDRVMDFFGGEQA
jgi:molecular chaperone DnaJ